MDVHPSNPFWKNISFDPSPYYVSRVCFFFGNRDIGLRENQQETTISARNYRGFRGFPVNCPIIQFRETS
jgi:hypothetical protein